MKQLVFTLSIIISMSYAFAQDISVFKDSNTGDVAYKFTYGIASDLSQLELYVGAEFNNNPKLPVVLSPVYAGTHALKIKYLSADGDWLTEIKLRDDATDNIPTARNLLGYQKINLWLLSDIKIRKEVLPKLRFGDAGSLYSDDVLLSDYYTFGTDVEANTWYNIQVPLAIFTNFSSFKDKVLKVQFKQNEGDQRTVTLLLDEVVISKDAVGTPGTPVQTGIFAVKNKSITASYSENTLNLPEDVKNVSVIDFSGKSIYKAKNIQNNSVNLNLAKGIYIINTDMGNTKISVK